MEIKKEKNVSLIGISKSEMIKFLNDIMEEVLNEGLTNYEEFTKILNESELNKFNNEFRLYGGMFGMLYIMRISNKINEILNKENKEN